MIACICMISLPIWRSWQKIRCNCLLEDLGHRRPAPKSKRCVDPSRTETRGKRIPRSGTSGLLYLFGGSHPENGMNRRPSPVWTPLLGVN